MAEEIGDLKYVPGVYAKKRLKTSELVNQSFRIWDKNRLDIKSKKIQPIMQPAICFSRKIGVGALEIADILAEKTGYHVVDREIIEHICHETKLSEKTVSLFDERYPGEIREFLSMAFGKKSFIQSEFNKQLYSAVYSIAGLGPTIFVGRGTHLFLPRKNVLAVRFISSKKHRIKRMTGILNATEKEAERQLEKIDKEQRDFFKKTFDKKDASPYEFDLVINCDYITNPEWAADIVALAFKQKFGS